MDLKDEAKRLMWKAKIIREKKKFVGLYMINFFSGKFDLGL